MTSSLDGVPLADDVEVALDGSMFVVEAFRRVPRDVRDVVDPCRRGDAEVVATFALPGWALARAVRVTLQLLVATCVDLSPTHPCPCGSPLQVQTCHGRTLYDPDP